MSDFLQASSRWLWDYYLLSTILLLAVWISGKIIRQPARRMANHWSAAVGLVLLALLCAMPGWSIIHMLTATPTPESVTAWTEKLEPTFGPAIQVAELPLAPVLQTAPNAPATPQNVTTTVAAQRIVVIDYGMLSFYVVAAGSVLLLFWLAVGAWQVRRLRRRTEGATPELIALLTELTPVGQHVPSLGIVADLSVAVAIGLRRPMILLPRSFQESTSLDQLQSVLAHELAHLRHRDLWLLALIRALLLVLWPNPLYWLWRRGVRLDQETLADAAAAEVTDRTDYAEQLVAWAHVAAEKRTPRLASSVGLWESPSQLKRRISILLDEKLTILRNCTRRWRIVCGSLIAAFALGLSLFTLQPATDAAEGSDEQVQTSTTAVDDSKLKALVSVLQSLVEKKVISRVENNQSELNFLLPNDMEVRSTYQFEPQQVLKKYAEPFDEIAGFRDAFAGVLEGLEKDPYGPRVDVQKEFVGQLAGEILLLLSQQEASQVEPDGRYLLALPATSTETLLSSVERFARNDPNSSREAIAGRQVWKVEQKGNASLYCVELGHLLFTNDAMLLQSLFLANDGEAITSPNAHKQPLSFVRLVVGTNDEMTFEGEKVASKELAARLEKVPARGRTVLEFAIASDELSFKKVNDLKTGMAMLANRYGFKYASFVGVHPLGSRGTRSTTDTQTSPDQSTFAGQIEVVAIGSHDEQPQQWWDTRGKILEDFALGWQKGTSTVYSDQKLWRRVILRVRNLPEDAKVRWQIRGASASAGALVTVDGVQNPRGYYSRYFNLAETEKTFGLRIGIATGSWQTVTQSSGRAATGTRDGNSVIFSDLTTRDSGAEVMVTHNVKDRDYRVVAVDKQGKRHIQTGFGGMSAGAIVQSRAKFPGLKPDAIERVEFQTRAFQWVEIDELPVQPGNDFSTPKNVLSVNKSTLTTPETASSTIKSETIVLVELVRSYEEIFKEVEALHKVGAAGGETAKMLLAKYNMHDARAKLLRQIRQLDGAVKQYNDAQITAQEYVVTAKASYDSNRITLQQLLEAQRLLADAIRNLGETKRVRAKQPGAVPRR